MRCSPPRKVGHFNLQSTGGHGFYSVCLSVFVDGRERCVDPQAEELDTD
jgi:hypothetical protein